MSAQYNMIPLSTCTRCCCRCETSSCTGTKWIRIYGVTWTLIMIQGPHKTDMDHPSKEKERLVAATWVSHQLALAGRAFCAAGCSRAVRSSCGHTHLLPRISYSNGVWAFNSCTCQRRQAIRHGAMPSSVQEKMGQSGTAPPQVRFQSNPIQHPAGEERESD